MSEYGSGIARRMVRPSAPDVIDFNTVMPLFGIPVDVLKRAAPAAVAVPVLDTVIPEGKFSGRMAAETRAYALAKKEKLGGAEYLAVQIKGAWCVCRSFKGETTYVEG